MEMAIEKSQEIEFRGRRLIVKASFKNNRNGDDRGYDRPRRDYDSNRDNRRFNSRRDDRRQSVSEHSKNSEEDRNKRGSYRKEYRNDRPAYDAQGPSRYQGREERDIKPSYDRHNSKDYRNPRNVDVTDHKDNKRGGQYDSERGRDYRGDERENRYGRENSYERHSKPERKDVDSKYERKDDYRGKKYDDYNRTKKYEKRRSSSKDHSARDQSIGTVSISSREEKMHKRSHPDRSDKYRSGREHFNKHSDKKYYNRDNDVREKRSGPEGGYFEQLAKKQLNARRRDDSEDNKPSKRVKRRSDSVGSSKSK